MDRESLFKDHAPQRTVRFQTVPQLDELLERLHAILGPAEAEARRKFDRPRFPTVLLVGGPRTGTTLMLQYLASLGAFCYPSNTLARFSRTPYIAALIERILTDPQLDPHGETSVPEDRIGFSSALGKTVGPRSPNEFNFFWRQFIPSHDPEFLDPSATKAIDRCGMRAAIAAIESVYGKPFAAKCLMLQYNIPDVFRILPHALFLYVRRKPLYTAQSILLARRQYYGRDDLWWSAKPPEYSELKALEPLHQVAGQVHYTHRAIIRGLRQVPRKNRLVVDYEALCDAPETVYRRISRKCAGLGHLLPAVYSGPPKFPCTNRWQITPDEMKTLEAAYRRFRAKPGSPQA